MTEQNLRRYTNLASTIHILQNQCLTLLNPENWDDRNDAFFMAEYQRAVEAKSVLALCFAEAAETYHHWKVFSPGSDGVCLEFEKSELAKSTKNDQRFDYRSVEYKTINCASASGIETQNLPFIKRYPYQDEREFRLIFVDYHKSLGAQKLDIPLKAVKRITLSPWMPKALADSIKPVLKGIRGCKNLKIYRSTLIENERWKSAIAQG